jgi:hypothetical protein
MHPLGQNGYQGYPGLGTDQTGVEGEGAKYSDINSILDQILNITDQSLDEAQVESFVLKINQCHGIFLTFI